MGNWPCCPLIKANMATGEGYQELDVIASGLNKFSMRLQKTLYKGDQNCFTSDIGAHAFLSLLSQDPWFLNGNFFKILFPQFRQSQTSSEIIEHYTSLFDLLNTINGIQITNAAFLKDRSEANHLTTALSSELHFVNFDEREALFEKIQSWFDRITEQKISRFADLRDDMRMCFLSSLRFKSNWTEPFPADQTITAPFDENDRNTVQVQMMRKEGDFYYTKDPYVNAQILRLPYEDGDMSLLVFLPQNPKEIDDLQQRLEFFDLRRLAKDITKEKVDVWLPKFKTNDANDVNLSRYSRQTGLEEAFTANLIGVAENEELGLFDIEEKLVLDVHEVGTETSTGTLSTLGKAVDKKIRPESGLEVYEVNMFSEISNRFAKTKAVWRVKNDNTNAADAEFKVVLTETAFITEFVMEVQGVTYKSYVKGKEEAKNIYDRAVAKGQSAGLVAAKTRDSREFTVSVNLEPGSVAVFSLTYEELLQRIHNQYELVINICPGQIVEDLSVEIRINESQPLKFVKAPPLRSGNEMSLPGTDNHLDPGADIKIVNSKTAVVKFRPDISKQKKMGHFLGNPASKGLAAQFVVQYDVEREPLNGQVLLQDGYFVHFFAPNDLDPLPKHIVFVLDTSGSMMGRKIEQLKDAMMNILSDLRKEDMLSIIEFNCDVIMWDAETKKSTTVPNRDMTDFKEPFAVLQRYIQLNPRNVGDEIIKKAKEIIQNLTANGSTFIIGGLETALYLVKAGQQLNENQKARLQPIIVFLTDGQPNVGINSTSEIVELVSNLNTKHKAPIFSLSFGDGADKEFLRKLSLKNQGFSRHIYEAADASLQLQDFYRQISSPLLRDIRFKYCAEAENVTRTWFPIYFRGSELVVAGRCAVPFQTTIEGCGPGGPIIIESRSEKPVTSLERLWAYLTVKQLLDERDSSPNPEDLTKKATNLALKYSFVTDVTSLVVVKPTETSTVSNRSSMADTVPFNTPATLFGSVSTTDLSQYRSMASSPRAFGSPVMFGASPVPLSINTLAQQSGFGSTTASFTGRAMHSRNRRVLVSSDAVQGRRSGGALFGKFGLPPPPPPQSDYPNGKKKTTTETFKADHPFFVMLILEKEGRIFSLLQGWVNHPSY